MKNPLLLAALFAASAVSADVKIATVDMDVVILAHPKTETNREEVARVEAEAEADRNQARGEIEALAAKLKDQVRQAQMPTLADEARAKARAEAEKLRTELQDRIDAARDAEAAAVSRIRREALARFGEVQRDIDEKIAALAAEKGLDLVLDSAAMRTGLPLPVVAWSSPALDLTDEAIAAVGGSREAAEELVARGAAARVLPEAASGAGADGPETAVPGVVR